MFHREILDRITEASAEFKRLQQVEFYYSRLIEMGCDDQAAARILKMKSGWNGERFCSSEFSEEQRQEISGWAKNLPA